jgi:predicted aspartyl protease
MLRREGEMAMLRTVLAIAFMLLASAPAPAQDAPADPAAQIEAETAAAARTTNADDNRMLAAVTIAGSGPYPFIVDTAAERSVIARELARELGLRPAGRLRMLSMTETREAGLVEAPRVAFLPGQALDLRMFALNGEHIGASGVLGVDALRGQRVVLDFEAQELRVGPAPRRAQRFDPHEIVVPGRRRYGQLVLADATANGAPIDVIVDTGLDVSVGNLALRRQLEARRSDFEQIVLVSITGQAVEADYARVDRIAIGGFEMSGLPVAFANAHFFERIRATRRPVLLLGMNALRLFSRVAIDFPNRRAYFVLPQRARAGGERH